MDHCFGSAVSPWSRTCPEGGAGGNLPLAFEESDGVDVHAKCDDNIEDVLILQHGRVHIRQKGTGESGVGPGSPTRTQPKFSYQNWIKGKGLMLFSRP
eukprot:1615686-Pyramimonas_sp.AAC.1